MSFDWNKFREVAERLRQETDEAALRTAISRVYYAAYWRARKFLETENFVFRQFESSHRQVWDEFKQRGRTYYGIGKAGDALRENRVEADYFDEIEDLDKAVEDSFKLFEKVVYYVEQIEKKQTN